MNLQQLKLICFFLAFHHPFFEAVAAPTSSQALIRNSKSACRIGVGSKMIFRRNLTGMHKQIANLGSAPNQYYETTLNAFGPRCNVTMLNGEANKEYDLEGTFHVQGAFCQMSQDTETLYFFMVLKRPSDNTHALLNCAKIGRTAPEYTVKEIRDSFDITTLDGVDQTPYFRGGVNEE